MGMSAGPQRGVKNEINVTPLVDVCLVLLIIFMVVTPMLQRGKDVTLPKGHQDTKEEKKQDSIILSITKDKKVYYDKVEVKPDDLEKDLASDIALTPGRKILLKGDQSLSFEDVRKVMQIAQNAKAKGIALGIEAVKDKQ